MKSRIASTVFIVAVVTLLAFSAPARATIVWNFEFLDELANLPGLPGGPTLELVGQIDTTDTLNSLGNYDVTSITGTLNGTPIGSLLPNPNQPDPYFPGNGNVWDNNLLTGKPFVDTFGIAFDFNGDQLVLFSGPTGNPFSEGLFSQNDQKTAIGTLCVAGQCSAPEPATLGLLGLGLAGLAASRRRKANSR